jgi:hypothetical protein
MKIYSDSYSNNFVSDKFLIAFTPIINDNYYNRIMVAGGGGSGNSSTYVAGYGGGENGGNSLTGGLGGTQTSGGIRSSVNYANNGQFGYGGRLLIDSTSFPNYQYDGGTGGGGWFGGSSGINNVSANYYGGGGGSGYIYTITSTKPSGYNPPTNYRFNNSQLIAGNNLLPDRTKAAENITGNFGNGFIKITLLENSSSNLYVKRNGEWELSDTVYLKYNNVWNNAELLVKQNSEWN